MYFGAQALEIECKVMKIFTGVILFSLGAVSGAFINEYKSYILETGTPILTANQDLRSHGGIVVPKGTVLEYIGEMPEGYIKANISIAIDGLSREHFSYSLDERTGYVVQYFIDEPMN